MLLKFFFGSAIAVESLVASGIAVESIIYMYAALTVLVGFNEISGDNRNIPKMLTKASRGLITAGAVLIGGDPAAVFMTGAIAPKVFDVAPQVGGVIVDGTVRKGEEAAASITGMLTGVRNVFTGAKNKIGIPQSIKNIRRTASEVGESIQNARDATDRWVRLLLASRLRLEIPREEQGIIFGEEEQQQRENAIDHLSGVVKDVNEMDKFLSSIDSQYSQPQSAKILTDLSEMIDQNEIGYTELKNIIDRVDKDNLPEIIEIYKFFLQNEGKDEAKRILFDKAYTMPQNKLDYQTYLKQQN
jgi:hypothetical protein